MRRAAAVLAACAAMAAFFGSAGSHVERPAHPPVEEQTDVPAADLDKSNLYFVYTDTVFHHNVWRCTQKAGCVWPADAPKPPVSEVADRHDDWDRGWRNPSYVDSLNDASYRSGKRVVTTCRLTADYHRGIGCGHTGYKRPGHANSDWAWDEWFKDINGRQIHDHDRAVIAAVCIADIEQFMARNDLEFVELDDADALPGWTITDRNRAQQILGRGWSDHRAQGETSDPGPRIAVYDHDIGWGGTAAWWYVDPPGGDGAYWHLHPAEMFVDRPQNPVLNAPAIYDGGSRYKDGAVYSNAMTEAAADSCFDDDPCGTAGVSEVQVCQCAANVNADRGRAVYPWVGSGGAWFRAYVFDDGLDTRDLELFAFDERGAMYQVDPMPPGVTPSDWPGGGEAAWSA